MTEVTARPGAEICDFCSSPDVTWAYPAADFKMLDPLVEWGSRGGWAACDICHRLIESNERERLAKRSAETFKKRAKTDPSIPRSIKRAPASVHLPHFRRLHGEFWRSRTGPAVPADRYVPGLDRVTIPDGLLRYRHRRT